MTKKLKRNNKVSTDQYRYITTYQSKHCEVEIYVDDNYDQKEHEACIREYVESLYRGYYKTCNHKK